MKKNGLSQEGLKLIACLTMLTDHIGAVLLPRFLWLRSIGRLAFPIYCFLLAEGFHHTRSRKNYALRLFAFMLLSEIPFDLVFWWRPWWGYQSVMVTLLLAFLMMWVMENAPDPALKCLAILPFYLAAELLHTDYGGNGVLMAALFHLTRTAPKKQLLQGVGLAAVCLLIGGYMVTMGPVSFPLELLAVGALVPIRLYHGQKQTGAKALQWLFYLFYPAHLMGLWLVSRIIF